MKGPDVNGGIREQIQVRRLRSFRLNMRQVDIVKAYVEEGGVSEEEAEPVGDDCQGADRKFWIRRGYSV